MKILALTRYSRLGASSRLRTLQYLPALEREGYEIEIAPFFDDAYLADLYTGRSNITRVLGYFTKRIRKMINASDNDLIWIEKEALPWAPWAFERRIMPRNVPYLVDYDDSVFHRYDHHENFIVRMALSKKIDGVMSGAACVTVGNDYLAQRALDAGARNVKYLPTVVDMDRYFVKLRDPVKSRVCIGWIGTPNTWKGSAEPIFQALKSTLRERKARFRAVGADLKHRNIEDLEVIPWSEDSEVFEVQSFDVGIMPLHDDPWTQGKCGYKLIQYMACGLPVVASPIGVNKRIVQHGVNGFLAETEEEWRNAVKTLIDRPELRRKMGAKGRELVQAQYSLQEWAPKLSNILRATPGIRVRAAV